MATPPRSHDRSGDGDMEWGSWVDNDDVDVNAAVLAFHMATTQNTDIAPNLEPEEQAYTLGLGARITAVDAHGSGWDIVRYAADTVLGATF